MRREIYTIDKFLKIIIYVYGSLGFINFEVGYKNENIR